MEKLYNKLRHELPGRLRNDGGYLSESRVTQRAIVALRAFRPDRVLVVRGDVLQADFWAETASISVQPVLWLYDELRRMTYKLEGIGALGRIASYSPLDVVALRELGVSAEYVPLAFDPGIRLPPRTETKDVSFIGARFAKRERYLTALFDAGLPVRAYGRDWSNHPVDRLRTFRRSRNSIPAGRDLPLNRAWGVMRDSLATLNIHGDQDGFTMRTFEACGVGAVQLIDRQDLEDLFEPGRELLTFDEEAELLDHAERAVKYPAELTALREAARQRALSQHTFVHRARQLEELWG
ncbi:MAG: glycosyltransferase [Propionibacteriaceae bacterium]|nr:glycosyltransferase [Propionibacteriaceae bacterium]